MKRIAEADDLKISPFAKMTSITAQLLGYGPLWWKAIVYVRAYNATSSRRYKAALKQKAGRIHAAGMVKEVSFERTEGSDINKSIDEAYETKYSKSPYVAHMISSHAKAATIKISPTIH